MSRLRILVKRQPTKQRLADRRRRKKVRLVRKVRPVTTSRQDDSPGTLIVLKKKCVFYYQVNLSEMVPAGIKVLLSGKQAGSYEVVLEDGRRGQMNLHPSAWERVDTFEGKKKLIRCA